MLLAFLTAIERSSLPSQETDPIWSIQLIEEWNELTSKASNFTSKQVPSPRKWFDFKGSGSTDSYLVFPVRASQLGKEGVANAN